VLSNEPKMNIVCCPQETEGWLKNVVSKIWTKSCDNSKTVRDRMSVTVNH